MNKMNIIRKIILYILFLPIFILLAPAILFLVLSGYSIKLEKGNND